VAIRESREDAASRRIDLPGLLTSAGALFALTYGLIEGHDLGWTSPAITASFAAFAALGLAFVVIESRAADPWLPCAVRERVFAGGSIALIMWGFGLFGIYFFTSLYLQGVLGFSPPRPARRSSDGATDATARSCRAPVAAIGAHRSSAPPCC